jgi:hypothetical protein
MSDVASAVRLGVDSIIDRSWSEARTLYESFLAMSRWHNAKCRPRAALFAKGLSPSLRGANGSRECAPDDKLSDEAIQSLK